VAQVLFERGHLYGALAKEMLTSPKIPEGLDEDTREEILFQLEDIAFEVQDKSLEIYEEGYNYLNDEGIHSPWKQRLLGKLKELDPQTYTSKEVLKTVAVLSGPKWIARSDTIADWYKTVKADTGWKKVRKAKVAAGELWKAYGAAPIWGDLESKSAVLKKLFLLDGRVTDATASITVLGVYRFFINGILISSDTVQNNDLNKIDTFNVKTFLTGGDNSVSIAARTDSLGAILFNLTTVIDTSLHYESNLGFTAAKAVQPVKVTMRKTPVAPVKKTPVKTAQVKPDSLKTIKKAVKTVVPVKKKTVKPKAYYKEFRNYGEFINAIDAAIQQEQDLKVQVKKTRTRIRGLKYRIRSVNEKIKAANGDIRIYKKVLESKERKKSD
jgi:hypothetical protein